MSTEPPAGPEVDVKLEQTLAPTATTPAPVTDGEHDTMLGGVDTAAVRNVIRRRVFGESIDPLRIGRFPILRRVGAGGMGVVYAAYDNELDRKVAIKLLRPGAHEEADAMRVRLLREAKALARLSDPGVVGVYEVGEHDGQVFVAMEFVEGRTLRQVAEADGSTTSELLALYLQAARGLAAAHDAGIVHRDFKPDNALVGKDGRVRVVDFGLATASQAAADPTERTTAPDGLVAVERLTLTGALLGTPAYMAPEQLAGRPVDARTDQFSFAVSLFEALFGQRPFSGATLFEIATAITQSRIDVPAGRNVPARVLRALRRALSPDPERRFFDMRTMIAELDGRPRRLAGLGVLATIGLAGLALGLWGARERERATSAEVAAASAEETAATQRTRAEDAEQRLRERADALTLAEARFVLQRDPTRAIALLANLSADATEWNGEAWSLATEARGLGIASHVVSPPDGYRIEYVIAETTVVLGDTKTDETAAVWNPTTGELRTFALSHPDGALTLSEDATMAVAGTKDGVVVLDIASGERRTFLHGHCMIPRFAPGHRFVAATCLDALPGTVWLVDLDKGTERAVARANGLVYGIDRDGGWIVTANTEGGYRRTDLVHDTHRDAGTTRFMTRAVSSDGRWIVAADPQLVELVDMTSGEVHTLAIDGEGSSAAFSQDGKHLALGTAAGELVLVALDDPKVPLRRFEGRHAQRVETVSWSERDRTIVSAAKDGEVAVWDVNALQQSARLRGLAGGVSLVHTGDRVVAADGDELRTWTHPGPWVAWPDAVSYDESKGVQATLDRSGRISVGARHDTAHELGRHEGATWIRIAGDHVATRSPKSIQLRDGTGRVLLDEAAEMYRPERPAASADGRWIAWDREDELIALEIATARRVTMPHEPGALRAFAFADDNVLVAMQLDIHGSVHGIVRRVDVALGLELASWPLPAELVRDMVAWPGHGMLLGTNDGLVRWDATTGARERITAAGTADAELGLGEDGDMVAVAPIDGPTRIIDLDTGDTVITGLGASASHYEALGLFSAGVSRQPILRDDGTVLEIDRGRLVAQRFDVPRDPEALRSWIAGITDLRAAPGALTR
ncbi:MAG TPA: serine/threonine-protein kinase [Nannocystaceae bacterium]|nr:serine/threonine-protein kinase [Nannocystaceae bacterium]